jgi:predicted permease
VLIGFGIIAFVIAVGYVAGRLRIGGPHAGNVLNRVAFFVTNPALMFTVLAHADVHAVFSRTVLIAAVSATLTAGLFVVASRMFFRRPVGETTVGAMASAYVNANNIGLPVAVYVLGSASYVAPILLLQLLVFSPIILVVLDIATSGAASVRGILLQPVRNPMILASIAGLLVALSGWDVPAVLFQPFELLGGAAVPLVLMAFGMSLHGARPLRDPGARMPVLAAALGKSIVMPAVCWLLALALGLQGHALFAAVALGALPSAQNVFNVASRYDVGVVVARDTVLVTTIAAVPAMLLVAALFA